MRRRALQMTMLAVSVAVFLLGVPLLAVGSWTVWQAEKSQLEMRAISLGWAIDRRLAINEEIDYAMLRAWSSEVGREDIRVEVTLPSGKSSAVGLPPDGSQLQASVVTAAGSRVIMQTSAGPAMEKVFGMFAAIFAVAAVALGVGAILALRGSRRISAPLIYLAAQAEQVGSGQVRARVNPSGIEEIDLVQAELVRTAESMAGRLAAERQFASDASHQLRTPLTALSMRLEEIEMIATDDEVRDEAHACLDQIVRLTGVVDDLLQNSRRAGGGSTQAIHLLEIFGQQQQEWEQAFRSQNRKLVFFDEAEQPVLASRGALSQVLATLIENSLAYGAGETTVHSRRGNSSRAVLVDVTDEGEGIDDEIAPDVFDKHVSGHGSTGIGLALARDLIQADGGRIELTQRRPPVFTISLQAVPKSLDPDRVLPQGAVVSVGRRRRIL